MATFTLNRADVFPAGTTVGAYPLSNFPGTWDRTGAPQGVATASAAVQTDGSVTFTGLADGTRYVAHAQVGGVERYIAFQTAAAEVAANVFADGVSLPDTSGNQDKGITLGGDTRIYRLAGNQWYSPGNGIMGDTLKVIGPLVLPEGSAPSGGSNEAKLFARDNGSGKTQLCVIFATGAVQVLATEP